MNKPLILIGAGGHCRSVIDAAESAGMTISGIIDRPDGGVTEVMGYPVLGDDDMIEQFVDTHQFIVTVGFIRNPLIRNRLHKRLRSVNASLATVIASTARVSPHAVVGNGTVVLHHATINANSIIGDECIINTAANIEHDAIIGKGTHISTGVMVNGGCEIGENVFIGSGTVVANGITVADEAIIGAGSLVIHNITHKGIQHGII